MAPAPSPEKALWSSCAAIFWPGSMAFGFPGIMAHHWQAAFGVDRAAVGQIFFSTALGWLLITEGGRWQERLGRGAWLSWARSSPPWPPATDHGPGASGVHAGLHHRGLSTPASTCPPSAWWTALVPLRRGLITAW